MRTFTLSLVALAASALTIAAQPQGSVMIERRTTTAPDGVSIVYSAAGRGEPALVFIHGGLANRGFYDGELKAFASTNRVIAPDLAGHGESGANRKKWGMAEFGADVKAVLDAEHVGKAIIFGNSMGGPVAIEAALLLPGRVLGVVGVDTFQTLEGTMPAAMARQRAEAFQKDYAGQMKSMVKMLFHPDADPKIVADAGQRMMTTTPESAYQIMLSMGDYDLAGAAKRLGPVPLRAINGDIYPTGIEANRKIKPDFDAVIMKHMGHYPMLERPAEFDRLVKEMAASLTPKS